MRKFTKFLTRHPSRNATPPPDKQPRAPENKGPHDFHQLTSSRFARGLKRSLPAGGKSTIVADGAGTCDICKILDFASLFDWKPGDTRPWFDLGYTLAEGPPTPAKDGEGQDAPSEDERLECPFCAFFRAMLVNTVGPSTKFTPYLRIRLAFEIMGVKEKHELGQAVLIEIMTRNKTLPWGYVVKAIEEGDVSADYWDEGGEQGGEHKAQIRGRVVGDKIDVAVVRSWIRYCSTHHLGEEHEEGCARPSVSVPGLMLVDCAENCIVSIDDLDPETAQYVALSYVWGEPSDQSSSLRNGKDLPEELPSLIADAMSLTRSLGFRYLWIDRYCFFPLSHEEKQIQVDLMGEIFASSTLTIIVAAGEGVRDGIPGVSIPREPQLSLQTPSGLFTTMLIRPDIEVLSSKYCTRAWTYQESLLSGRRLVLTPSQAYFQCRTLHCYESLSLPLRLAPDITMGRAFPKQAIGTQPQDLKAQIKTYMTRDLSRQEDRLDAIKGVLGRYATLKEKAVDSFLGLPLFHPDEFVLNGRVVSQTDRLAVALGWKPILATAARSSSSLHLPDTFSSTTPRIVCSSSSPFPSWTWLSWYVRSGTYSQGIDFNLSEDLHGVAAPPKMEVSVGFKDEMVLSWEIDGDKIANRRQADVHFLRLRTFCFTIRLVKDEDGDITIPSPSLSKAGKGAIETWFRTAKMDEFVLSDEDDGIPNGEYQLHGVVISGRHWRSFVQPHTNETPMATVLICGHVPNLSSASPKTSLTRLGVLTVAYNVFTQTNLEEAVLEGVWGDGKDRKDLKVRLQDVDIY